MFWNVSRAVAYFKLLSINYSYHELLNQLRFFVFAKISYFVFVIEVLLTVSHFEFKVILLFFIFNYKFDVLMSR